jgi:hypothetical protein
MFRYFESSALYFVFMILFKLVLDASYFFVVSREYSYAGFHYDPAFSNYTVSWLLYLSGILLIAYQAEMKKVSDYFLLTLFLGVLAPILVLYGLDCSRPFFPVFISFLVTVFLSMLLRSFNVIPIPTVRGGYYIAISLSFISVAFLVFWYLFSDIHFNFSFVNVYEYRDANLELTAFGLLAYTNTWTQQVFNIFLISICLHKKKYFFAVLFVIVQVFFYSVSTHKSVLFYPFLIFGIWLYFRSNRYLTVVPFLFSLVVMLGILTYWLFDDIWVTSLFSRRVFFVPADLTFVYFDFFSENPKVYWSNSILKSFIDYPYDQPISHVVGSYLGDESLGANNGFIASGYAHGGLFGVFAYASLVALLMILINSLAATGIPMWLVICLTIVPVRAMLISSDLFTSLLTHGLLASLLIIALSRKKVFA